MSFALFGSNRRCFGYIGRVHNGFSGSTETQAQIDKEREETCRLALKVFPKDFSKDKLNSYIEKLSTAKDSESKTLCEIFNALLKLTKQH